MLMALAFGLTLAFANGARQNPALRNVGTSASKTLQKKYQRTKTLPPLTRSGIEGDLAWKNCIALT
jgi:hypothetical protein